MLSQTCLLSIVLSNLVAWASALPEYTAINNCPTAIDIHTPDGRFTDVVTGSSRSGLLRPGNNFLYADANGNFGVETMGVGLNQLDGDNYYYYLVKDIHRFSTGINIAPSPAPNGLCPTLQCDDISCPFAFAMPPPPPKFSPVVDGASPAPPFYWCPAAPSYDITFCPSGSFPVEWLVSIRPGLNAGKCLHVRDGNLVDGAAVDLLDCDWRLSELWYINPRTTQVRAATTNLCLDAGSNPGNRTPMTIRQCVDGLPAQTWYLSESHNTISVSGKGQCLDVTDGLTGNGQQMQTWECTPNNPNQVWSIIKTS